MPNVGRITVCPFYMAERPRSITCEDAYRLFRNNRSKEEWMDRYCDNSWKECEYAQMLLDAYDRYEGGDLMALENEKLEAVQSELRKVRAMLGRTEKRCEAKDEEIKKLRKRNRLVEDRYIELRKVYEEEKKRGDFLNEKLFIAMPQYEARFCFLMEKYAEGIFDEAEFTEWSRGKEFRLEAAEKDAEGNVLFWRSNVREVKDEPTNVYADKTEQ